MVRRWEIEYFIEEYKWVLALAVVVVLALIVAWPHVHRLLSPQPKPVAVLTIEVRGEGEVYVNNTRPEKVGYPPPWTAVLKARPAEKWKLAYWLVNGSKLEDNPLTIVVRGNTSVVAVFARAICTLSLVGREGVTVYLNGTAYVVPREVEVPCNSTLLVKPEVLGLKPVEISVVGDVKYEVEAYVLVVEGNSTHPIYINETEYEGFEGWAIGGVFLNASCVYLNETHGYCAAGWRINGEEVWGASQWIALKNDTYAEPIWVPVKKEYPPIKGEVALANGTTKKVTVISGAPYMLPIFPFTGEYQYLGNATYRVVAKPFAVVYIALPRGWKEVRVEVLSHERYERFSCTDFEIILRNDEVFHSKGYGLLEGRMVVIFRNDPRVWGPDKFEMKCKLIEGSGCNWCASGPGKRILEGLEPGWLRIHMANAEVIFRIVVELGSKGSSSCCG